MVNIFGERLKKLRTQNKLSQDAIASLVDVNRMTVVKWEKGTSEPSVSAIKLLAFYFDVDFSYLIGEDNLTLFLLLMAERFAKAQKNLNNRKNSKMELAQWIIYWNNMIEACLKNGRYEPWEEWHKINESIGWSDELSKIKLNFPEDYNIEIIDYIVKSDYNGLVGNNFDELPYPILLMLPEHYRDKPELYKHLLGYADKW